MIYQRLPLVAVEKIWILGRRWKEQEQADSADDLGLDPAGWGCETHKALKVTKLLRLVSTKQISHSRYLAHFGPTTIALCYFLLLKTVSRVPDKQLSPLKERTGGMPLTGAPLVIP